MRIKKSGIRKAGISVMSAILILSASVCTALRISEMGIPVSIDTLAAETTMPSGIHNHQDISSEIYEPKDNTLSSQISATPENPDIPEAKNETEKAEEKSSDSEPIFESSQADDNELKAYDKEHEGEEKFPVKEMTITRGDISYQNIQVKNASSFELDIKKELDGNLGFKLEKTDQPQVLIYHTHTCESFLTYDTGYYYESFYPRSKDKSKNVCAVGEEITKQLNNAGIKTIHDTTLHDDPSYSGAYYRSTDTVEQYLKKYPSIKVVLDIHRDGIGTENQRSKPVFSANGKKAAQIMILAGYNYDNDESFKDWEYNLRFALKLQEKAQQMYPDMTRPLYLGDFMYNMNINSGSLLIEIGSDSNTIEEVRYSGYLLGNVISELLDPEQ